MMNHRKNVLGFTILEVAVIVVIIVVLLSILVAVWPSAKSIPIVGKLPTVNTTITKTGNVYGAFRLQPPGTLNKSPTLVRFELTSYPAGTVMPSDGSKPSGVAGTPISGHKIYFALSDNSICKFTAPKNRVVKTNASGVATTSIKAIPNKTGSAHITAQVVFTAAATGKLVYASEDSNVFEVDGTN